MKVGVSLFQPIQNCFHLYPEMVIQGKRFGPPGEGGGDARRSRLWTGMGIGSAVGAHADMKRASAETRTTRFPMFSR